MTPLVNSRRRLALRAVVLTLAAVSVPSVRGQADPAVSRIRAFYAALLDTMKQADRLGVRGRYDKLAPVIGATFDLPAMTRIAVGPEWNSIAPDVRSMLIENFTRMTVATYATRFDGYSGERFDVEPLSEVHPSGRIVRTQIVPSSGAPVTLNYLMRGSGDDWKVVDVYLTGTISELATRRAEFGSILKSGGPAALVASLRERTDKQLEKTD